LVSAFLAVGAVGSFSCGGGGVEFDPGKAVYHHFSGAKALGHVEWQEALGARVAGSGQLEKTRQAIERELSESGWVLMRQASLQKTPFGGVEFVNLRARFAGAPAEGQALSKRKSEMVWRRPVSGLLMSHYETKKFDSFQFLGANDPGSSVGTLLEMARVLAGRPVAAEKIELVFFDGEEALVEYTDEDGLYGSRHYAKSLLEWPEKSRPQWGVLLDMVGDKNLAIRVPRDSPAHLLEFLYAAAEDAGLREYFGVGSQVITDDHKPLNEAGVPTIDIIDMDYAYWHTPGDTSDKLSVASLEVVGKVALLMIEKYLLDKGKR